MANGDREWSLGSKLKVSNNSSSGRSIKWWAQSTKTENNCFFFFPLHRAAMTSLYQKPSNEAIYGRFADVRSLYSFMSLFSLPNILLQQFRTDIFVVFIYGLQMIYFSILWWVHRVCETKKKIDRSIWFMAFKVMNACAQLFNVFDMCRLPYLEWRSQILCAPN